MLIYLIVAILMFLSAMVQSSLPVTVNALELHADFVLLLVVAVTLVRGLREGLIWAFIGGLLLGVLSPYLLPLGSLSLMLIAVAVLTSLVQNNTFESNLIMPLVIVALSSATFRLILLLVSEATALRANLGQTMLRLVLPAVVIDIILAPLLYTLIAWLDRRLGRKLPVEWQ